MNERPILFSAPMVRALLDGSKTQTRRVTGFDTINRNPDDYQFVGFNDFDGTLHAVFRQISTGDQVLVRSRYGKPGDRLWVRETWQGPLFDDMDAYRAEPADFHKPDYCEYAADGGPAPEFMTMDDDLVCRWRPSIHMPRWASRITLEITGVRVERLNDCSDADALAEGIDRTNTSISGYAQERYRRLWEQINGSGSWDANPWVWVIEFKPVAAGGIIEKAA